MIAVDLRSDAREEAERLAAVRAIVRDGDDPDGRDAEIGGPWIAIARGRLRRALRGRDVQIWRVAFADRDDRQTEQTLVAVTIDAGVDVNDASIAESVERAASGWRVATLRRVAAFGVARAARERSIATAASEPAGALQPGLFDRRAEHARAERSAAEESAAREQRSRAAAAARSTSLRALPPRLLLALKARR